LLSQLRHPEENHASAALLPTNGYLRLTSNESCRWTPLPIGYVGISIEDVPAPTLDIIKSIVITRHDRARSNPVCLTLRTPAEVDYATVG
jgi:hypothetical protein